MYLSSECLGEAAVALLALGAQEMQSMIADSSSCAVLGLLLRVLFSPDIILGGRDLAERLSRTALECFQPSTAPEDLSKLKATPAAVTLFYAMAGDRSGSYFLEAVVECCGVPLLIELLHGALQGSAKEYAMDGVGNFVLQAVLRRLSAELERGDASGPELNALRNVADTILGELTEVELFNDLAVSKGGVVLWILELVRWTKSTGIEDDWAEKAGSGLLAVWTNKGTLSLATVLADRLAPKAALEALAASKQPPKKINGRVVVDKDSAQLLIARLIGALLKLNTTVDSTSTSVERASALVAQAVFMLPLDTLKHVATSGPLSRAVLDNALDLYVGIDNSVSKKAVIEDASTLLSNLSILAVDLADHFIGQHVLKRAFDKGSAADKESIVTALDVAKEQLGRTKEGRNSLRIVQAELFARKPDEWRSLLKKHSVALEMLKEIETGSTGTKHSTYPSSSGSAGEKQKKSGFDKINHDNNSSNSYGDSTTTAVGGAAVEEEDGEAVGAGNRKRKRKRPGKKNTEESGEAASIPVAISAPAQPIEAPKAPINIKVASPVSSIPPPKVSASSAGERSIDMRKIQKLRSGKVTSLTALGDEIESMAKRSKAK